MANVTVPEWQSKAIAKKKSVDSLIPKEWKLSEEFLSQFGPTSTDSVLDVPKKFLLAREVEITGAENAAELIENYRSGKYSVVEVIKAYLHRSAIATQLTNCCTELMFDYGLQRAKFLDDYFQKNGKLFGPLHGLPISLKDSCSVVGFDSTLGFIENIGNSVNITENSSLTKMLIDLGAVLYVKSNIPQTLMTADSENHIFGKTLNPNNLSLTSGGSSGGEGALIKQKGSIMGIGTDIAGSIRIPLLCCGIYGLKPSTRRVPDSGNIDVQATSHLGPQTVVGPMANSMEDIELLFNSIIKSNPWKYDNNSIPMPLKLVDHKKSLKIGYIVQDDLFPVHPTVKKFVNDAVQKLKAAGHDVTLIKDHPCYNNAWKIVFNQFLFKHPEDRNAETSIIASGEPPIDSIFTNLASYYVELEPSSMADVVTLLREGQKIKEQWANIFKQNEFDIILTPGASYTAPPHNTYGIAPYTAMWNLVDYPALIIPFGHNTEKIDEVVEYPGYLKGGYPEYDKDTYFGAKGAIQLIAPYLHEEELIAYGKEVDKVLH